MNPVLHQSPYGVRFDWGPAGARAIAAGADVAVVVDVLSFSTSLSMAADLGIVVLPYPWEAEDAPTYAAQNRAVLAVGRSAAAAGEVSVSPASIRAAGSVERLVLPSPNGSAISVDLASIATTVVGASLRNAPAVADWIAREHDAETASIAVVAAGERWADGSLRPAIEDLWGAGAVLAALEDHDWPGLSPEAAMAADAYRLIEGREESHLKACAGGSELVGAGHAEDVVLAAEIGAGRTVPLLSDRGFIPAP
ncbi:2-phosphosulfolactate phosphatase [Aeromicrobium sp. NPDC092404]|uniref:2-phosphosulfolactate phosphatase n=1 Tax=Aeromicrobium sp. NPDC092404 TaxID=3154976 RepID=UPI00343D934E